MKPAPFDYVRATSMIQALAEMSGEAGARPVAGGQSLGPLMNLRLARPGRLVDISRLTELCGRARTGRTVTIGACVTHATIEDGEIADPTRGFLTSVASRIAYRAIRNRGTIGGSLAHADPAADWLSALMALGARLIVARLAPAPFARFRRAAAGVVVTREIDIGDFVVAPYTTALGAGELLAGVEIPEASADMRWGYFKFCRKAGELADAIGAVAIDPQRRFARVVAGAVGGAPLVLRAATQKLASSAAAPLFDEIVNEIGGAAPGLEAAKRQQVAVCVERAIAEALRA